MSAGKSDLNALKFLIPDDMTGVMWLPKTIIFFDDISLAMQAWHWFTEHLPPLLHERVKEYHVWRTAHARALVMHAFIEGEVDILLATEAAGMVRTHLSCAFMVGWAHAHLVGLRYP